MIGIFYTEISPIFFSISQALGTKCRYIIAATQKTPSGIEIAI
jgi:hypothetical protein